MQEEKITLPGAQGVLFVCCTSHMDWDWIGSFEDYYSWGLYAAPSSGNAHDPVRYTLDQAFQLFSTKPAFRFNLAEVAWLQRWLQDNPQNLGALVGFGPRFGFLGGGFTSPDNLICHGEVFIRNYLVGRQYLKTIGLNGHISNNCWIPDDFGQDPELPATLNALGMKAAAFWRVPGFSPGSVTPVDGSTSIFEQLKTNGVCFNWKASDGSVAIGFLMADGYGVPFYISETSPVDTASELDGFVQGTYSGTTVTWPNNNLFVPAGGDFSTPSSDPSTDPISSNLTEGINNYNQNYYKGNIFAQSGTFDDYLNTLGSLGTPISLNPSNYWTGYFASRPQLKIDHNKAARYLMAAETAFSMLQAFSRYSSSSLAGIYHMIQAAWEALVPSSHHDFVTGTSPDNTYWSDQLPLLETAVSAAKNALDVCLTHLGKAVDLSKSGGDGLPVLVYNDLGFQRDIGTLTELSGIPTEFDPFNSVSIDGVNYPIQKNASGKLLFQCPPMSALSYQTVYLSGQNPSSTPASGSIQVNNGTAVIQNGRLTLTLSEADNWGIISLIDNNDPSGTNIVNGVANQIVLYSDEGNLYQFGNELYPTGFSPVSNPDLTSSGFALIESGPLRWRFQGILHSQSQNITLTVEYTLVLGEPLVRMAVTGSAPAFTTVVTCFNLAGVPNNGSDLPNGGLSYGTANHWHLLDTVPYWTGPTFLPTHDFVLVNGTNGNLGGIYHRGIPAWTMNKGVLMGALLRNAGGTQRGAAGTDFAVHTQEYAFRLPGVGEPDTCQPLQESYSVQEAPFARLLNPAAKPSVVSIPTSSQLASLNETNALIRVVRTQAGSGSAPTNSAPVQSGTKPPPAPPVSLVFRVYQPSNDTTQAYHLNLLFDISNQPVSAVECISALEETSTQNDTATISGNTVEIDNMPTLTTVRVQMIRPYLEPSDGR